MFFIEKPYVVVLSLVAEPTLWQMRICVPPIHICFDLARPGKNKSCTIQIHIFGFINELEVLAFSFPPSACYTWDNHTG